MAGKQRIGTIPQSKDTLLKSYNRRLKDDVKSMLDNFTEIVRLSKADNESQVSRLTQAEQDENEMHTRAANVVRAGESLMKLISDIKQFLILNDFPSVNDSIAQRTRYLKNTHDDYDHKLMALRDDLAVDLYEIEEEYYTSRYK
ncbi:mediator of RNA polymerase II transcription subunit 22-like [Saccoglossus kowalevskii]|uniref:Mediator of RNA polymerase II transcription subunit 22 n=1 Tax=Saccoglossus kowalevskii TaxID=10224 RepID=A0ABM0GRH9_SACKO|nr:PREDICTED: mediator of RNA polymerase II transcription subunit 22-like [Saccoglossus kowalevskii]